MDWLIQVAGLFSDVMSLIMASEVLRFFAGVGVFLTCWNLAMYLMGTGKTLAR